MGPTDHANDPADDLVPPERASPLHGYRGDRTDGPGPAEVPAGLTIAFSREAGSRGSAIASRAAHRLGWPVYNQELLEYIAQEGAFRQKLADNVPPAAAAWVEGRLNQLLQEQSLSQHPAVIDLARIILVLGAQGEAVLLGRGAGCILPRESTLHVRVVAPRDDRVAYLSDWLRLPVEAAAEQVRLLDARRAEFLNTHFHRQPGDVYQYDLLLNSSLLGEELCAELVCQAARAKAAALDRGDPVAAWAGPPGGAPPGR